MSLSPLPDPDLEGVDYELWGQNVRADCWFEAKVRAYAEAYAAEAVAAERNALCDRFHAKHNALLPSAPEQNNLTTLLKMITIPITQNFDGQYVIGTITIDESKLPPTPNFVFSIGYRALDPNDGVPYTGAYTLLESSIVSDSSYYEYLKVNHV